MNGMKNKILALDSNIFIYHFEENPSYIEYTNRLFKVIINGDYRGITSIISAIEALSYPSPPSVLSKIEEKFKTLPNFTQYEVTEDIGLEAARIRRNNGFRLPDSIQLATAIMAKADVLITNDARLQKFRDIDVVLLKKFFVERYNPV